MQLINKIGHLQHWGLSPASNILFRYPLQQQHQTEKPTPLRILLSGCSDIRHILKTVSDVCQLKPERPIHFYLHQIKPELLARMLLQLHILHQQHLNFDERMELFLDLYGNSMIKQRNAKYLNGVREDFLNLIHDEKKKVKTPLKHLIKFDTLKFEERDDLSQVVSSWSTTIPLDMPKLRDTRMRYLFGQRYDYRANLVDWDYNILLSEGAPIIHYYHYKEWRLNGLAFQQRFSTYTEPNRTLASYAAGRKKQEKTSCLVRGYWGDMVTSPYIAMGIHTDYKQKDLLFKKANQKYIGHSVELTEYHMQYWLHMLEKMEPYAKIFRDYYRTDQKGRQQLDKAQQQNKNKKNKEKNKRTQQQLTIQEQPAQQDQTDEQIHQKNIQQKSISANEQQKLLQSFKQEQNQLQKQEQIKEKQDTQETVQKKQAGDLCLDASIIKSPKLKKEQHQQQLDSDEEKQKQIVEERNSQEIKANSQKENKVLAGFQAVQFQAYLMAMNIQGLNKPKYKQFFDIVVLGFIHSAYIKKGIASMVKKNGQLHCEKPTFLITMKKQQRKELVENMSKLLKEQGIQIEYQNKFFFIGEKSGEKPVPSKKQEMMLQR